LIIGIERDQSPGAADVDPGERRTAGLVGGGLALLLKAFTQTLGPDVNLAIYVMAALTIFTTFQRVFHVRKQLAQV